MDAVVDRTNIVLLSAQKTLFLADHGSSDSPRLLLGSQT